MISALKRSWIQLSLVATAAVWGVTFVMVKDALQAFPLYSFMMWRFAIAVVAFLVLFPKTVRRLDAGTVIYGSFTGAFLCFGYVFQSWGLTETSASNAAFITGMFVVITPVMQAVLIRHVPRLSTAAGALVALGGLWLLSGGTSGGWNVGDTRVLICAVLYSAHMIAIGTFGKHRDVFAFTFVQLAFTAVVCGAIALATEPMALPQGRDVWTALAVTGVLATAVAFAVQTYAQKYLSPSRTALILVSEPAFGGLFGWLAGETLGLRGLAGAVLILVGMVASELAGIRRGPAEKTVVEPALEGPSVTLLDESPETV